MTAKIVDAGNKEEFARLARERGSLFLREGWLDLFGRQIERVGLHDAGGSLIGGFAYWRSGPMGLPVALNPPFTPDCGPFLAIRAQHPVSVLEARRAAIEAMAKYLLSRHCALHLLRLARDLKDTLPFYYGGFRVVPAYTYILPLQMDADTLLGGMASVRRRNIQRAAKDGLEARELDDLEVVGRLVRKTFARQKKRLHTGILDRILNMESTEIGRYAYATFSGERPIACAFCVHDSVTAYYLLGGYSDDEGHHGAGPMAMWACIQRAQALGLRHFDFEGSMIPAIEKYFRAFGGEFVPYFTVNRAWLPIEMVLKFKKRNLF